MGGPTKISDFLYDDQYCRSSEPVNRLKPAKSRYSGARDLHSPVNPEIYSEQDSDQQHTNITISCSQKSNFITKKSSHEKTRLALTLAAIFIFTLGVTVSLMTFQSNKQLKTSAAEKNIGRPDDNSDSSPDETRPGRDTLGAYSVDPSAPRLIEIPKINVLARVLQLGTKSNNQLQAPGNIYDAGWYSGSAKPGLPGATLIDGHVHGLTKPGVFSDLSTLISGDEIIIEKGDHSRLHYRVVKIQKYNKNEVDMAAALVPIIMGKSGLNLMTCTGDVDTASSTYNERLIVFASLEGM